MNTKAKRKRVRRVRRRAVKAAVKYLTVGEVEPLIRLGVNGIRRLCADGTLDCATHANGHRRITVDSVRTYMQKHGFEQDALDQLLETLNGRNAA